MCLEMADLLVAVSDGIRDRLTETGATTRQITVRNGIKRLRSCSGGWSGRPKEGPFQIVYTGSFYHTRDPFPFLEAVHGVVTSNSLGSADLAVRFFGTTREYSGRSIQEFIDARGLGAFVHLHGWTEPEECRRQIESADALLLLALDQPDQVPNKLYEYLGTRRPILAVADEAGEVARMLDLVGGHSLVPTNDAPRIRCALEGMLGRQPGPVGDVNILEEWTTEAQMTRLCSAVKELA